ncbi:hypothetical protein IAD21_02221 [Abditibacteriota bacterium]|nr:hypothetical protein IAD21_02221 [Abditibacteriota bacterium]
MSPLKWKLKRLLGSLNVGYAVPLSLEEKLWHLDHDAAWMTVNLPIDGHPDRVEEVLVEKVGDNRYRIASSPGMMQGLAANDIIALDAQNSLGFQLLQRGTNVCIHVFCDAPQRDSIQAALTRELGRIGGGLDGTMGQTGLCFTVPVAAGFSVIEGVLQRVVGEEWSYSNVYDPETGNPLNWWLKQSGNTEDNH